MRCDSDDYIFMSKEKNRSKLYERIRKNFVRISSELGLYMFNGKLICKFLIGLCIPS